MQGRPAVDRQVADLGHHRISASQVARETVQGPSRIMEEVQHVLGVIFGHVHPEVLYIQLRDHRAEAAYMVVVGMGADHVLDRDRAVDRPDVLDDRIARVLKAGVDYDHAPLCARPIAHRDSVAAIGTRSDGMKIDFVWHQRGSRPVRWHCYV
jgi:hypothetical protein